jgi:alpha-beta hydrolase superfamily lysophospholipase
VVAVSWGAKLAIAWAMQRPQWVSHLLLAAPGLFPQVDVSITTKVQIGLACAMRPAAMFPIPLNDPALFTENPAGRRFIRDDSLKLTQATARFLKCSRDLDVLLGRTKSATLSAQTALFLAEGDRIIRNDRTEAWVTRVSAAAPRVTRFPAASHTLEFEYDIGPFEAAVRAWASEFASS